MSRQLAFTRDCLLSAWDFVVKGVRHIGRRLRQPVSPRLGVLYQYSPRLLSPPGSFASVIPGPLALISIVTPSFNHGRFLERTIRSVLDQEYPRLEYIVQDGASKDETVDLLQRYRDRLSHCESVPDNGQADAINRGFRRTSGTIMAYLNSDDILLPGSLSFVADYFHCHPEVDVLYGHRIVIDSEDREIGRWILPPHDGEVLSWSDFVPQETMFWRRSIWERSGGRMDESFQFALDWDLLLRFRDAGACFARVPRFLGGFRAHPQQKTNSWMEAVGRAEISRLRLRSLGRTVSETEVRRHVRPYIRQHIFLHLLGKFGYLGS